MERKFVLDAEGHYALCALRFLALEIANWDSFRKVSIYVRMFRNIIPLKSSL
jgi:hypothetical protein